MFEAARQIGIGNEDAPNAMASAWPAAIAASAPRREPAAESVPVQIDRNSTIADGTFW